MNHSPSGRVGLSGPERVLSPQKPTNGFPHAQTPHPAATASDLPAARGGEIDNPCPNNNLKAARPPSPKRFAEATR